jgi:hypothetical protein
MTFNRDSNILYLNYYRFIKDPKNFDIHQYLIHDPNQLPSLTFIPEDSEYLGYPFLIKFKRLPPPYDSNCFDYEKSKSFKSRGQCINDCVFKKILKKYDCIPRESVNVLTLYDNMTLDSTFCMDNKFEGFSEDDCSNRCIKPCEEILYKTIKASSDSDMSDFEGKKIIYINKVYMTFIYFMSSIGGLLGLWNNVSVYDLQLIVIKICGKIFKLKLITKLSKYICSAKILKSFDLIRSFVTKINFKVKKYLLKKFYLKLILFLFFRHCL